MAEEPRHDDTPEGREEILKRDGMLIGVAILSLTNGMHFSPWFDTAAVALLPILRGLLITSPLISFYLVSLFLATATLVLSGVPAAILERATGRARSDSRSLGVWLACAFLLALPALASAAGLWR
jgi:hypothetical protein